MQTVCGNKEANEQHVHSINQIVLVTVYARGQSKLCRGMEPLSAIGRPGMVNSVPVRFDRANKPKTKP